MQLNVSLSLSCCDLRLQLLLLQKFNEIKMKIYLLKTDARKNS